MTAPDSPDKLVLRGTPNVGPRLGKRAMMIGAAVGVVLLGVIIFNTESRKAQQEAKPKAAASEADQRLQPSTEAAASLTRGITDQVNLAPPPTTPSPPFVSPAPPPPNLGHSEYAVPDLTTSAGGAPNLAASEADVALRQAREQAELEARRAKTQVADWDAGTSEGSNVVLPGSPAGTVDQTPSQLADRMAALRGGMGDGAGMPGMPGMPGRLGPSDQERKQTFIEAAEAIEQPVVKATRQMPRGRYELKTGDVIRAVTLRGINSDLPGDLTALVTDNVYDSATGAFLLIPAGSKLFGRYDSQVAFGQNRALAVWTKLIFPDGSTLELGGMAGSDPAGYAGFEDKVNNHYGRLAGFALLTSIMSSAFQLSQPQGSQAGGQLTNREVVSGEIGKELTGLGIEITRRNLNVQPTIEVRPGYRFAVTVNKDVAFAGPYVTR